MKQQQAESKRFVVNTTEELHKQVKALAVEENTTISNIIKKLLKNYLTEKRVTQ